MTVADNLDLSSLGAAERAEVLRKRFPDARAIDILKLNREIRESATGSVGSAVKGERVGIPKSWAEKNKKDDEYEKKQAAEAGENEPQAELPRTDETQTGAGGADIGPNTPDGYVTAKKQPGGKYKLFFTGTRNEVFSGELFDSAKQARDYFKVRREKLKQAHTTPKTTSTSDLPSAGTGTVSSSGEASNVAAEMKKTRRVNQEV